MHLFVSFCIFYLDDGTLGGPEEEVLRDFQFIECEAEYLGLDLNESKTELIWAEQASRKILDAALTLYKVPLEQAVILGSPIGQRGSIDTTLADKTQAMGDKTQPMGTRLSHFSKNDAITLLRYFIAIPKVLYLLRTAPCFQSLLLKSFDLELRSCLSAILNVDLVDNSAWTQATLPIGFGGIGVRNTSQLAPSAFLASAAGCVSLTEQILPPRQHGVSHPGAEEALQSGEWVIVISLQFPLGTFTKSHGTSHVSKLPLMVTTDPKALGSLHKASGAWPNVPNITSLGLRMDNEVARIAVGLRLGVPLCHPHKLMKHNCGLSLCS